MKPNYKATLNASFTGYIVQAIVNNFVPLLFVTFNTAYNIPYTKITFLIIPQMPFLHLLSLIKYF